MSNQSHSHRKRQPEFTTQQYLEQMREQIAANLQIDRDRIRFGDLGRQGRFGTNDPHWLVFYKGTWRELPWHFDGPLCVTRDLVRQWYGEVQ